MNKNILFGGEEGDDDRREDNHTKQEQEKTSTIGGWTWNVDTRTSTYDWLIVCRGMKERESEWMVGRLKISICKKRSRQ